VASTPEEANIWVTGLNALVGAHKSKFIHFITWTMHFHIVNETPTNAVNNYILLYPSLGSFN
jgi:hypothetical protein